MIPMVHITIDAEDAESARREMLKLLGLAPKPTLSMAEIAEVKAAVQVMQQGAADGTAAVAAQAAEQAEKAPRTRRTKAQIEADKAAAEQKPPAIQTNPESRVGPEDDPEVDAQDQADEQAEVEAQAETPKALTHDDVRGALGAYVKKFGMDAAQQDGPKLFKLAFGDKVAKISDIPNDQDSLSKAVNGVNEMLTKNPYKREPVKA